MICEKCRHVRVNLFQKYFGACSNICMDSSHYVNTVLLPIQDANFDPKEILKQTKPCLHI